MLVPQVLILPIVLALAILATGSSEAPQWRPHLSKSEVASKVNVEGWTDSPKIGPDGKRLYFMYAPVNFLLYSGTGKVTRGGPDRPGATTHGDATLSLLNFDIYEAQRQSSGKWRVKAIRAIDTAKNIEICPTISFDGNRLYFERWPIGAQKKDKVVYVSEKTAAGWGRPRKVDVPSGSACDIQFNEDESEVYYDDNPSDPNDPVGAIILRAKRNADGSFGPGEKLPDLINAPGFLQGTPWLSKDGKRLYFNRSKPDLKGNQLMVASRQEATGDFESVKAVPLGGIPTMKALGGRIFGVPSLTADERYLYLIVNTKDGVPQVWSAKRSSSGQFERARPVD